MIKEYSTQIILGVTVIVSIIFLGFVISVASQKTPQEEALVDAIAEVNLEGKVQTFEIEGRDHVDPGVEVEGYKTNPPTSGTHWSEAQTWGGFKEEVPDGAAVHGLEHGGIWITYKDISEDTLKILGNIQRENKGSVILSPRSLNDSDIVVASWGKMMSLEESEVDTALIQKYINTNINDSPEQLAN